MLSEFDKNRNGGPEIASKTGQTAHFIGFSKEALWHHSQCYQVEKIYLGVFSDKLGNFGLGFIAPFASVENTVMAYTLLNKIDLLARRQAGAEFMCCAGLPNTTDIVFFAFDGHQRGFFDDARINFSAAVEHCALW